MRGSLRPIVMLSCACALALATSGCGHFVRHGSKPNAGSTKRFSYGEGEPFPSISTAPQTTDSPINPTTGILRVQILDDKNKPLQGAIVTWKGPVKGQKATDARGNISVALKPGTYDIQIAPCGTTVITETSKAGTAVVTAGTKTPLGVLDGIRWRPRFRPENSARVTPEPPWNIGQVATVALRVQDGCTFGAAKSTALPTFGWRLSNNYAFARSATYKTDASGYVSVTVRCVKQGDGMIELYDRIRPENNADVILSASSPDPGHSWCEA